MLLKALQRVPLPPSPLVVLLRTLPMVLSMAHISLTLTLLMQHDQVNAAAGAIVPQKRPTVASACRHMNPHRHNPGASEDANAESVYLLTCARAGVGDSGWGEAASCGCGCGCCIAY